MCVGDTARGIVRHDVDCRVVRWVNALHSALTAVSASRRNLRLLLLPEMNSV